MTAYGAWAALGQNQKLVPYFYKLGELGQDEVEIAVEHCGLCYSDLSMVNNDRGLAQYPLIPGREAVGRVVALGNQVKELQIGQKVGVGWTAGSCMHCHQGIAGAHQSCSSLAPTIIGRQGGFAERIRTHWEWATALPDNLDLASAGPLLCAGASVFTPFINSKIKPNDHVGIVGTGSLGHLGLKFAKAWGCEVTVFTSSPDKFGEAKRFGAHKVINGRDGDDILKAANSLDLLLITIHMPMDWTALHKTLRQNGRMAIVGAVLEPMQISAIDLIFGQKRVVESLSGGPAMTTAMLEFSARHNILPLVENFPMSQVNEAMEHLASGKARFRIVLDADFA